MARKFKFHQVLVDHRIYDMLNKKRLKDMDGEIHPLKMNAYCENILWDYARGKLIRQLQHAGQKLTVDAHGEMLAATPPSLGEDEEDQSNRKHGRK